MNLLRFLGSIHFALGLFCLSALFVAYASLTDMTISLQHSAFKAVIGAFFINLLVSLGRRFPFRRTHLPFVCAHCGLLLILSGCILKSFLGFEGALIATKNAPNGEMFLNGHRASALLQPLKRACAAAGFSFQEILSAWLDKERIQSLLLSPANHLLSSPLERTIEQLDWTALPLTLRQGALRMSYFLNRFKGKSIAYPLAKHIFEDIRLPIAQPQELTASVKAHLFSCCLFVEDLHRADVALQLKQIPHTALLKEARAHDSACTLLFSSLQGEPLERTVRLNAPYDTPDGFRFSLATIADDHVELLVSYDPTQMRLVLWGSCLTALGIASLFYQKWRVRACQIAF